MVKRRRLNLGKRSLMGLDLGASAVRIVQLCRDGDEYLVLNAGMKEVIPWGDDPTLRRIHTAEAIRDCLSAYAIGGRLAVCGLRGSGVVVRGFEFPALPPEEIEAAVTLEASQICPFGMDDRSLDCQVTSSEERSTYGFWVAATNELIQTTRRLVQDAGLRCTLLDVDGLALLNCLEGSRHPQSTAENDPAGPEIDSHRLAILDVGDSWSTVAIADDAGRPFVRDIGSGSEQVLQRFSTTLGISGEAAIAALAGDLPPNVDLARLPLSFERACVDLVDDIAATLRYYGAQNGSARVDKMLVCGRFATIDGFIELLRTNLAVAVESWNPLAAMHCDSAPECETLVQETGASMAVAAGLAMRSI